MLAALIVVTLAYVNGVSGQGGFVGSPLDVLGQQNENGQQGRGGQRRGGNGQQGRGGRRLGGNDQQQGWNIQQGNGRQRGVSLQQGLAGFLQVGRQQQ